MNSSHIDWTKLPVETLMPGLERQFTNTEHCTLARFFLRKGVVVPEHHHPNEQIAFVLSGSLRFRVEGKEIVVKAGEFLCIPMGARHSAEALEDTIDFDVFTPPRADWADGNDGYLKK